MQCYAVISTVLTTSRTFIEPGLAESRFPLTVSIPSVLDLGVDSVGESSFRFGLGAIEVPLGDRLLRSLRLADEKKTDGPRLITLAGLAAGVEGTLAANCGICDSLIRVGSACEEAPMLSDDV